MRTCSRPWSQNESSKGSSFLLALALAAVSADAQPAAPPTPEPDVLIFTDGEKLIGHLIRSTSSDVMFKSDVVGQVTVPWSKVQELHSSQKFAVIAKGVKLHQRRELDQIPQGTLEVKDQKIEVTDPAASPPTYTAALTDTAFVVDQAALERVRHTPPWFQAWKGAITAGASMVEATQHNRTFTGAIALVRAVPTETWLDKRGRTIINLSATHGKLTQPDTPSLRTSIYHGDAEHDEYFSPRAYGFGLVAFDHNFSQGLRLQQSYGLGLGWTVVNGPRQSLDLKVSANYGRQKFDDHAQNQNLFGSTFSERYARTLPLGILLNQQLAINPAWNHTEAYTAVGSFGLTVPVYKRFSLAINAIDNFLNNPPPGFKKNSFQLTTGLTYTLP